jgi:hypothetical protein
MKKDNKKMRIMLKKIFTKDQLLVWKKYNRLLAYDIPYAVINRAYHRYVKNIDDYASINGYSRHWFSKDINRFCNAVKVYIESKKEGYEYRFGTRGYINMEIVKVSEIDKIL